MSGEGSLIALLVALSRLGSVQSRMRERAAHQLAPFSNDPGLRRLVSIASLALHGDLAGALEMLEDPAPVLEAAARLEEALSQAADEAASKLAGAAEWAASRLLYYDAALLYVEAVRIVLEWRAVVPLDREAALLLLADLVPQEQRGVDALRQALLPGECFPRRYCPSRPPRNVDDARQLYSMARRVQTIVSEAKLPSREALQERLLTRIEAPRLLDTSRKVLGNIPGMTVVLRPEDLQSLDNVTVAVYDNERESLENVLRRAPVIAVPAFKWAGASVESLWFARHGGRLANRMRDEAVAAPVYSLVRAVYTGALTIAGSQPVVRVEGGELRVEIPGLGLKVSISGPVEINALRKNLERELIVPPVDEGFERALARGVLRGLISLGSSHEYGQPADS